MVGTLVALRGHSVHKVSLQFQTFITKARDKTDKLKLIQNNAYVLKFFSLFSLVLFKTRTS